MTPKNKTEFYERYKRGEFGNHLDSWTSVAEIKTDNRESKRYCVRSFKHSGQFVYGISWDELIQQFSNTKSVSIAEIAPDNLLTIQGEIMRRESGELQLRCSRIKGIPLRVAMENDNCREVIGLAAVLILRQYLDPSSLNDLNELLSHDWTDSRVIEFSTYKIPVGKYAESGRNTLIWEVRNY